MPSVSYNLSREIWDKFISDNHSHTFLQSWLWGEFNKAMGDEVIRFAIADKAVVQAVVIKARRGKFLFIPHGFIFDEIIFDELKKIAAAHKCDFIRICTVLPDSPENRTLFAANGFRRAPIHVHPEFAWIKDISHDDEKLLENMRKTTRYSIRKAEKDGVTTRISSDPRDLEIFWDLYAKTAHRQRFVPFSKKYLETEFRIFGDDIFMVFAEVSGEPVSCAMIVLDQHEGYYHHGASLHHPTASYLVQWVAMREARRRGKSWYNFWGVWPDEDQKNPQAGLSNFKKGYGGQMLSYLPAQDFALTAKYWLNYVVEKARKKIRGF